MGFAYGSKLFENKVGVKIQLSVRDALESSHLQAMGANPDGTPYTFRIVDPRQFILTTTFNL